MKKIDAEEVIGSIEEDQYLKGMFMSYHRAALYTEGKDVLDFGCGYGWGAYLLSANAHEVIGLDIDTTRIDFAKKIFSQRVYKFICYDICEKRALDRKFSVITAFQVLPFVENVEEVLEQLYGSLEPDGIILISIKYSQKRILKDIYEFINKYKGKIEYERSYYLSDYDGIIEIGIRFS